jgi:CheY-like chemotaxis protein
MWINVNREDHMQSRRRRILIVDDDHGTREVLKELLVLTDYDAVVAKNGIDALKHMVTPLPEVIISDLQMPVMSGYEFMAIIRHRFPQIPVIAMSGEYPKGQLPPHIPADAYLAKGSFLLDELCSMIEDLLKSPPDRPSVVEDLELLNEVPVDAFGSVTLQCTNCLRHFKVDSAGLSGGYHSVQCCSCQTSVRFKVEFQQQGGDQQGGEIQTFECAHIENNFTDVLN